MWNWLNPTSYCLTNLLTFLHGVGPQTNKEEGKKILCMFLLVQRISHSSTNLIPSIEIYLLFILLYILILQGFYNLGVCLPPVINWLLFIRLNYDLSYCHSTIFAIKPSGLTDPSAKWESCSWQAFIIHTRTKTTITSEIKIIEAQTRRTYLFNGLQCSMMISEKASLTVWHSTRFSIPG